MTHTIQPLQGNALASLGRVNVNWTAFLLRAVIRGAIVWPILRYLGGVDGVRGLATSAAIGAGLTSIELAFDAGGVLMTSSSLPPAVIQASTGPTSNVPNGTEGLFGTVIDANGNPIGG